MANLETLELRVTANAESAAQGLSHLIGSLSALSNSVGSATSGLSRLNEELSKMKGFGNLKLPGVLGGSGSTAGTQQAVRNIKHVNTAIQEQIETITGINRVAKSAKSSANFFEQAFSKQELKDRLSAPSSPAQQTVKEEAHKFYVTAEQMIENEQRNAAARMASKIEHDQFMAQIYKPVLPDTRTKAFDAAKSGSLGTAAQQMAKYDMGVTQAVEASKSIRESAKATKETTDAFKESAKAVEQVKAATSNAVSGIESTSKSMETVTKAATTSTEGLKGVDKELRQKKPDAENASEGMKKLNRELSHTSETAKPIQKTGSALSGLTKTIGRITKTMMIRSAIRTLISGAKEGLNNFYQYSKSVGSSYASSLDSMAMKTSTMKNQIGAALGSALAAVIPILNAITAAAIAAANAITALFALLGGSATWSKASASADGFAKSVGGGGSAMKELLADFDELNIIASQGGGGGGGGGMDFGAIFTETPFPSWMTEWLPVIKAVLAGTLGALILPKIFEWLSKIFKLFGGPEAKDFLQILKYLFGHGDGDDDDGLPDPDKLFPEQPEYKPFPEQPKYVDFPSQPPYVPFPEPQDYSDMASKLMAVATNAGLATAAVELLQKAIEGLQGVLGKLSAGLSLVDLIKNIIGPLLSKLLTSFGNTIHIKVDKEEFEKFKKEFDEYKKGNHDVKLRVLFDSSYMDYAIKRDEINKWIEGVKYKKIGVMIDSSYMTYAMQRDAIDKWADAYKTKKIGVLIDNTYMSYATMRGAINKWIEDYKTKKIGVMIDNTFMSYATIRDGIDKWIGDYKTKKIGVMIDNTFMSYATIRDGINKWIEEYKTKKIGVMIDNTYMTYATIRDGIDKWIDIYKTRSVGVSFDNSLLTFTAECLAIDAWITLKRSRTVLVAFEVATLAVFTGICAAIDAWIDIKKTKAVGIGFDGKEYSEYIKYCGEVDKWVASYIFKKVGVTFDGSFDVFNNVCGYIDRWVQAYIFKKVGVSFDASFNVFNNVCGNIDRWVLSSSVKLVYVGFETKSFTNFWAIADAIDAWANETLTKIVNVVINETGGSGGGSGGSGGSGGGSGGSSGGSSGSWLDKFNPLNTFANLNQTFGFAVPGGGGGAHGFAKGAYDIPEGDLFIANEAGAELVGSINGKTSVANQGQIIEGIQKGVRDANAEQNALLRQQNDLLRSILEKDNSVRIGASAALGRIVNQSTAMYNKAAGLGGV